MSLVNESGCTEPNNQKSINPYVSVKGNILVSECCTSEAVYRVSDEYGFDRWSFCPQCLESCEWVEKSISDLENEDMILHKDNKDLFDEMSEYYAENGLPVKCNEKPKYPHYEDVLKVLDNDGFYDGHFDDLLPWTFSLSDFQHPDREIDLLVDLWNGNLDEETVVRGCLGNGGYIYYVEAHALLYEIVISPNMGLDSISIIGTEEEVE
jgi:hypothetical protein